MIQEILHGITLLVHDLSKDLGQTRDGSEVMRLKRLELPQRRRNGVGLERIKLIGEERVYSSSSPYHSQHLRFREKQRGWRRLTILRSSDIALILFSIPTLGLVNHDHAAGVTLEHIVDEGDDGDDSCGRSREGETSEALDEGGYQVGGKVAVDEKDKLACSARVEGGTGRGRNKEREKRVGNSERNSPRAHEDVQ